MRQIISLLLLVTLGFNSLIAGEPKKRKRNSQSYRETKRHKKIKLSNAELITEIAKNNTEEIEKFLKKNPLEFQNILMQELNPKNKWQPESFKITIMILKEKVDKKI